MKNSKSNSFYLHSLPRFVFDAMHAVTGAYAKPIFVDKLGANPVCFKSFNFFVIIYIFSILYRSYFGI